MTDVHLILSNLRVVNQTPERLRLGQSQEAVGRGRIGGLMLGPPGGFDVVEGVCFAETRPGRLAKWGGVRMREGNWWIWG